MISKCCEVVKLCHINRTGPVFQTHNRLHHKHEPALTVTSQTNQTSAELCYQLLCTHSSDIHMKFNIYHGRHLLFQSCKI